MPHIRRGPRRNQEPNHKTQTYQIPSNPMATSELKSSQERENLIEDGYDEDGESAIYGFSDDSDEDPTFDILEETQGRLSRMSLKKSRPRISKDNGLESDGRVEFTGFKVPELDEKDGKCFDTVEMLIREGHLEKLKVDQCKVYLRKYGLRLTGNKDILIARIREHLEVLDGDVERKYPTSSFVLSCKGDACTGDVVMFEQNVYEMYNIASRSATGPPCGTRTVVGRIVKDSYGAAKQQHTFTIEVLWSKGEKPLPPLHPLLIKGRNLYRLQTIRQRWVDEEVRRKVLQEKHTRGSLARCSRENRIQEKESRKKGGMKRMKENRSDCIPSKKGNQLKVEQPQRNVDQHQNIQRNQGLPHYDTSLIKSDILKEENTQHKHQNFGLRQHSPIKSDRPRVYEHHNTSIQAPKAHDSWFRANNSILGAFKPHNNEYQAHDLLHFHADNEQYRQPRLGPHYSNQRQPLSTLNSPCRSPQPQYGYQPHARPHFYADHKQYRQHYHLQRQLCRYYRQGRCKFEEGCKYLHD